MAEYALIRHRFLFGLAYVGLMCLLLLVNLMPNEFWPRKFPGPDLMVAVTFVWLLRRPRQVPPTLIAVVFFVADILLMRPLGLWAALMVIAAEFLRSKRASILERAFIAEWALASGTLLAATLVYAIILSLTFFQQGQVPLDKAAIQAFSTVLAYPLVAVTARFAFGVTPLVTNNLFAQEQED